MTKRNITIDTIKGVAIFLVIIGHAIQYCFGLQEQTAYLDNTIYKAIYSFHMPLFMLISGYLSFKSINQLTTTELLCKRIKNYILPILLWGTLSCLIKVFVFSERSLRTLVITYWSNFWFIWSVFIFSIIVSLIENKLSRYRGFIYVLILILAFVTPDLAIQKYMFPFFLIGYFVKEKRILGENALPNEKLLLLTSVVVFFALLFLFDRDKYIYTTGFTLLKCSSSNEILQQLYIDFYRYLIGFLGSISAILLIRLLSRRLSQITKPIATLGKDSIGIYIVSTMFFLYIIRLFRITFQYNLFTLFIISIAITAFSYLIVKLIGVSKFLRSIAFGKL